MNKKVNIVEHLRKMIRTGELQPGQKLKNGIDLAADFKVAHLTMRRALRELELSGDIQIIHGRGIFVSPGHSEKRKFLIVRSGISDSSLPTNYLLPYFLQRCNELGIEVDEADLIFLRHSPIAGTVRQLKDNQYTGVLLCCNSFTGTEPELQLFRKLDIPTLIPRGTPEDAATTGFGVLRSDERRAWEDGLKYLKSCHVRKVGVILLEGRRQNMRGYTFEEHQKLLKKYGFSGDPALLKTIDVSDVTDISSHVEQAVRELMALEDPPDTIYCYSDFVALYVYLAARQLDLQIPEDLSVMGFCGYPGGKLLSPPLATVDCDYASAGILAAELLCDPDKWSPDKKGLLDFIIPHKIKKRASVAAEKELTQ